MALARAGGFLLLCFLLGLRECSRRRSGRICETCEDSGRYQDDGANIPKTVPGEENRVELLAGGIIAEKRGAARLSGQAKTYMRRTLEKLSVRRVQRNTGRGLKCNGTRGDLFISNAPVYVLVDRSAQNANMKRPRGNEERVRGNEGRMGWDGKQMRGRGGKIRTAQKWKREWKGELRTNGSCACSEPDSPGDTVPDTVPPRAQCHPDRLKPVEPFGVISESQLRALLNT
ncbi:hypothetical protein C8J57DRAFT_1240096 [Mycena rebaudengoi]|nr:hypothetical protein C8J57DRAFT_1240096 [Mycena rebaudengoi]